MFKIKLWNIDKKRVFIKTYTSYYFYKKDLEKYRRSKKLKIISTEEL